MEFGFEIKPGSDIKPSTFLSGMIAGLGQGKGALI
jgi:hypothetical protein